MRREASGRRKVLSCLHAALRSIHTHALSLSLSATHNDDDEDDDSAEREDGDDDAEDGREEGNESLDSRSGEEDSDDADSDAVTLILSVTVFTVVELRFCPSVCRACVSKNSQCSERRE